MQKLLITNRKRTDVLNNTNTVKLALSYTSQGWKKLRFKKSLHFSVQRLSGQKNRTQEEHPINHFPCYFIFHE